jgi:hypothetical protein
MNGQISNTYEETFYIIPRYIRKLPNITLAYLDIYETIFQFWNKNKACFLGEDALCERTNYKRAVIYKALNFFENHNELQRIKKNGKRYLVRPMKIIETDCELNDYKSIQNNSTEIIPMSTTVDPNVYNRRHSTSTTVDHNIKNINKEINIKENTNYVSIKESEIDAVVEAAQECLENTKNNLPSSTGVVTANHYQETNYPVKKEQAITILMAINTLGLSKEYLSDLIKQRKAQNGSLTERALKAVYKELIKLKELGFDLDECLDDYANATWRGFKAEYFINSKAKNVKQRHTHDNSVDWINGCDFSGAI